MPFYRDNDVGTAFQALQDFTPTGAQSLIASTGAAFESNPTVLGYNAAKVALANQGDERVPGYEAGQMAKDAGVPEFAPGDGYTRDALNLLIERRRQEKIRADVMQRTPYSWTGTPVRAAGVIGASLLDPLNIAAAFVPAVAPARYAALLEGAAGAGERALVRGAVGAVQGATGMALIEPAAYAAHQYLQDDYGFRDSLLNIAFGAAFGGGLHVIGGALADGVGPGRFVKGGGLTPAPGSAAGIALRADPETRIAALQTSVGQAIDGRNVDVMPVLRGATDSGLAPSYDARLQREDYRGALTDLSDRLVYKGGVAYLTDEHGRIEGRTQSQNPEWFQSWRERDPAITTGSIQDSVKAALAGEKLKPKQREIVQNMLDLYAEQRATSVPGALDRLQAAREARSERQALQGYNEPLPTEPDFGTIPGFDGEQLRAAAQRGSSPEAISTADFPASRAADERLAEAPKEHNVEAAQAELTAATQRLQAITRDLEASGVDPRTIERLGDFTAHDEAIADANKLGQAMKAAAVCGQRVL